eukprot:TRINITY_DN3824_c0_g1_i1.p1 TRINITY_DN3824_c0_g1~~TRINITY_DN3824_c0_g1_i1.p1  ORF type:complete len:412 (-),score=78.08 TRINITY_DN3824_c0_g1_i1:83-1318(-)
MAKGGKKGEPEDCDGFAIPPGDVAEVKAHSSCYLKLLVDDAVAGYFIGNRGHTKKDIERQSGALTLVSGSRLYYPGTDKRVIVLAAPTLNELNVAIYHTVKHCSKGAAAESKKNGTQDDGTCALWIVLPDKVCGKVLGKGGSHVNHIAEQTGIMPRLSKPGESAVSTERLAVIQGGPDAVVSAVEAVAALVSSEPIVAEHLVTDCDLEEFAEVVPPPPPAVRPVPVNPPPPAIQPTTASKSSKWQPGRSKQAPVGGESGWQPPPPPAKKQHQAAEDSGPGWQPPPPPAKRQRQAAEDSASSFVVVPPPPAVRPSAAPPRPGPAGALPKEGECVIYFEISELHVGSMVGDFFKSVHEDTGVKPRLSGRDSTHGSAVRTVTLTGEMTSVHQAHAMILARAEEVDLELRNDYED